MLMFTQEVTGRMLRPKRDTNLVQRALAMGEDVDAVTNVLASRIKVCVLFEQL